MREGGAVEFTEAGRKQAITAYQQRKQEKLIHPLRTPSKQASSHRP